MFFITATLTVGVFIQDRREGFWNRTLLAGVTTYEMLLAHVMIHSVLVAIQIFEYVVLITMIFDGADHGSHYTVVLILLLLGLAGMFYGFLLSCICADFMQAVMAMFGISQPMIALAGMLWPLEGMPTALRYFSYTMPFTLPSISLKNIVMKGYSILHPTVLIGLIIAGIWTVAGIYLGIRVLRTKKYSRNT